MRGRVSLLMNFSINACMRQDHMKGYKGSADELYGELPGKNYTSPLKKRNGNLEKEMQDIRKDFENLPVIKAENLSSE